MTFEDWLKLALQSNVVAALIVGGFSILTLKLGLIKFRSEKWWERKAASYVATIEAMHAIYAHAYAAVDAEASGHDLIESYRKKLSTDSLAGLMEIRKAASIGPFLMNKNAAGIIAELIREIDRLDMASESLADLHRKEMKLVYEAILSLRAEAKRDLQTP
jgi:hypothetical protein